MKLKWKRITAHTKHVFRIARSGSSVKDGGREIERTIVGLEHQGILGLGEAAPTPFYKQTLDTVEAMLEKARPMLAEHKGDIRTIEQVNEIVDRLVDEFDDQRAGVAAVDEALHDWLGKSRKQPVWMLLGLDPSRTPPTSMTVGIDTPELIAEKVKEVEDFQVIKVKVGTDNDEQTLKIIREAAPKKKIRVDANCGWPADKAAEKMRALLPFNLEFIEQPIATGQYDAVRELARGFPIPILADEDSVRPSDVKKLADAYQGINVKLSKCGGIREAVRMIGLARARNMQVMLGCMVETSVGVAAAAQIASLVDYTDLDGHLLLADDPFTGLKLVNGVVLPSDDPGLGVKPQGEFTW